jgi:uncharacterized membrane protein
MYYNEWYSMSLEEKVVNILGSWRFVILQSIIIVTWLGLNIFKIWVFDPYPFTFLNLALSFEAAFTAPIIMLSQNKATTLDREREIQDYIIDTKAQGQIETILQKLNSLERKLK